MRWRRSYASVLKWDAAAHPRGEDGRFTELGSLVETTTPDEASGLIVNSLIRHYGDDWMLKLTQLHQQAPGAIPHLMARLKDKSLTPEDLHKGLAHLGLSGTKH